jgi:ATP synthase F0 subunit b
MPRPDYVRDLISGECVSEDQYRGLMGSAVRSVVALQECAGIDVLTDGEWWRKSYIGVIAELAHGFELSVNPADGRPWTIVVDKLAPKQPGFIAREVAFLKQITGRNIKATLPAPALLGERMWDPDRSAAAYPTREDFIRDSLESAKKDREESEAKLKEYTEQLTEARAEAKGIVDEGRRDAEVVQRKIEDDAKAEAAALVERARREIQIATDTAVKSLYDLSGKLATDIASRIIRKELNPAEHERLIAESIDELSKVSRN